MKHIRLMVIIDWQEMFFAKQDGSFQTILPINAARRPAFIPMQESIPTGRRETNIKYSPMKYVVVGMHPDLPQSLSLI
jgi:hypothetical protein